jgi:hypothetical protein
MRNVLPVLIFTLSHVVSATAANSIVSPPYQPYTQFIAGLDTDKISMNVLRFFPGQAACTGGDKIIVVVNPIDVDMGSTGLNGIDADVVSSGKDYFPYIVYDEGASGSSNVGIVMSNAKSYGHVVVPTGYKMCRKLRFGFRYNGNWGGIPNFHNSYWPNPFVRLTDAEYSSKWGPCFAADCQAEKWTSVSFDPWLPDNARMAYIMVTTHAVDGRSCSGFVRSYGGQSTGIGVGSVSSSLSAMATPLFIRTTSLHDIQYRVTAGCRVTIQVLGYNMTEPS